MAPVISSISPTSGPAAGGTAVTINGSGFTGATSVKFGTVAASSFTLVSDAQITTTAPAGSGPVAVTVVTPGGTSNGVTYTYLAAPVITSLSPVQGPAAGGTSVLVNGSGFTSATSVKFGSATASFSVVGDNQIAATAPAGAGAVAVTVISPGGTSNGVTYTYVVAPALTLVLPNKGTTAGGNSVTLNGSNLTGATSVDFGSRTAVITSNTATQITVTAPTAPAAPVSVSVTTPGGTSAPLPYYYIAPPAVSGVDPAMGPSSGGNTVSVYGANLTLTSVVRFGATAATGASVVSDSQINAIAPSGSGTVSVTVTTAAGTSPAGLGGSYYSYLPTPALSTLKPGQGPVSGGTSVTLVGSALTYTDDVRFAGVPASFTVLSDTQLVATAPPGALGPASVVVHTPAGNSNSLTYQYLP
ncbi:IPT/TIG domain-containing protein [Streptomyces inhibens]|uniref:IPT/TIG domain-containing protein n=1 Tax=Streptomyces inhibens TaxID=2293571 RepID=UPI0036BD87C6